MLKIALAATAALANPEHFKTFRSHINQSWIAKALAACGIATLRRRRLPAEQVVWLVIGMALFRDRPIDEVVSKLDLALPASGGREVAHSALPPARDRLGAEPMQVLFEQTAATWSRDSADAHRWRGLALYGVDGTSLRVPDSPVNRAHFGGHSGGDRGDSAYPMMRLAALMVLRSHLLAGVRFGPHRVSEHALARELWPLVPDDSLTIVDRNFLAACVLIPLASGGSQRHWMIRAKRTSRWTVIESLAKGDELVELKVSSEARRKDPTLPKTWRVRAIQYHRKGYLPQTLFTSLLDPKRWPANEVIALYHERWELELGYDEIKTEMLDSEEALRSKTPVRIAQETWGLVLAYNLVRLEMERIAHGAGVVPVRISFVMALRMIRDEWLWCAIASPGAIPRHLVNLRAQLSRFVLPERRPERRYPRAVKIKMSSYAKKRPETAAKTPN